MGKNGFTLMEIMVAAVLFSLVIVGLLSVFITGNKQVIHARERMVSSELSKLFVDPMQAHVRQDTWGLAGNALLSGITYCDSVGGHTQNPICPSTPAERKINNRDFTATYTTTNVTGTDLQRVTTTITWNEPSS
jgi:prepilin-type N-terminal cleavage/methylation domain-containing protein